MQRLLIACISAIAFISVYLLVIFFSANPDYLRIIRLRDFGISNNIPKMHHPFNWDDGSIMIVDGKKYDIAQPSQNYNCMIFLQSSDNSIDFKHLPKNIFFNFCVLAVFLSKNRIK